MDAPPSPSPSPHPSLLALARAWPHVVADPVAAAGAYERALQDLDPGAVNAAVASLARDGRAAPPPGLLRTVVLARATPPRTAPAAPAQGIGAIPSAHGPRTPAGGSRIWALMLASSLLAGLSVLAHFAPWITARIGDGRRPSIAAADPVLQTVLWPLAICLAAIVFGRVYVQHRRPARHLRGVFILMGLVGVLEAFIALLNLDDIRELQREAALSRTYPGST